MAERNCEGDGSGWGTIEGSRLRVLIVAPTEHMDEARAVARALSLKHDPVIVEERGFFSSLHAANAAKETMPHLIHAIGVSKTAQVVASGVHAPFLMTLGERDLEKNGVLERVNAANAVMLESGAVAEALRKRGIGRELYVIGPPPRSDEDLAFLGAVEVVYGRVVAGAEVELDPEVETPAAPPELVQIGRKKP
jgi:hypothetical protein